MSRALAVRTKSCKQNDREGQLGQVHRGSIVQTAQEIKFGKRIGGAKLSQFYNLVSEVGAMSAQDFESQVRGLGC